MEAKKKRGPKPTYKPLTEWQAGAPQIVSRVTPEVYEWVKSRTEGTRPYLERIVLEDKARTSTDAL